MNIQITAAYPEVLKVVSVGDVALAVQLGVLVEVRALVEAVGREDLLVVEEGDDGILGVPGAEDDLRGVQEVGRQHRERQVRLDDALALKVGGELHRVGVEPGHPDEKQRTL